MTGREKASPFSIFYRCDGQLCYFADFKPISLIKEDGFFLHIFPFLVLVMHIRQGKAYLKEIDWIMSMGK